MKQIKINNPVKVALTSMGMSSLVFHAPFFTTHPGFILRAVWERTRDVAKEKYPEVSVYRHLEDMLADESIDLVVVNTPNVTHAAIAEKCLLAGKHVVVEKPFTPTVAEAQQLIALAMEKQLMLSVFHNRRWDSDYLTVKKVLDSGCLGTIREVEIHFDRFEHQLSVKQHKELPVKGTGILYDLGSHIIDQALQLFGMPQAVFADIMYMRANTLVNDYFELLLYYQDFRVRLKGTYQALEPITAYVIHGSKGSFHKKRADVQENDLKGGQLPVLDDWGIEPASAIGQLFLHTEQGIRHQEITAEKGCYSQYFDNICQHIRQAVPLWVNPVEAMLVISIIEMAWESHEKKQVIFCS